MRWEGCPNLEARLLDLQKAKTGLWQVKAELFELLMADLGPVLVTMEDTAKQMQLRSELRECLGQVEEVVGRRSRLDFGPTYGPLGQEPSASVPC